nr:hypothetical protein P5656_10140 [Bacillus subtilis]
MKKDENLLKDLWFIAISAAGGFILSLTGISIGWMIGTLIVASLPRHDTAGMADDGTRPKRN